MYQQQTLASVSKTLLRGMLFAALFVVQSAAQAAPSADLAVVKTVDNPLPREGDTIVYTLTLTNNGPDTANNVDVTDVLPAGVTYVSDDSGGSYDNTTGVWVVAPPLLAAAGAVTIHITATVNAGTLGSTITNTATITSSNRADPDTSNNTDSVDITVVEPNLTMVKSALTTSDPVNGASSPYNIPGATVLYSLQTTNTGLGVPDTDSTMVTDAIPANTELFVNNLGNCGPVAFIDGSAPINSGLSCTFTSLGSATDDLEFSNDNGATWTYTPVPDANGYDANVTNIRVNPKGVMRASDGTNNPTFTLRFQVRVQ